MLEAPAVASKRMEETTEDVMTAGMTAIPAADAEASATETTETNAAEAELNAVLMATAAEDPTHSSARLDL
jgi:hypothetical protein